MKISKIKILINLQTFYDWKSNMKIMIMIMMIIIMIIIIRIIIRIMGRIIKMIMILFYNIAIKMKILN